MNMKVIALILAVFVAFPNLGNCLGGDCCSNEKQEQMECHEDASTSDNTQDTNKKPCAGQCDCSCCQGTFLMKDEFVPQVNVNPDFTNSNPLNQGKTFAIGFYGLIWQPPK